MVIFHFKQILKVIPRTELFPSSWLESCAGNDYMIPQDVKDNGIQDSDMHFFITASNEPNESFVAWATYCDADS